MCTIPVPNTVANADDGTRTRNPRDYKPSALAIELYSSKAIAGKELSLSILHCIIISLLVPEVPVSSRTTVLLG